MTAQLSAVKATGGSLFYEGGVFDDGGRRVRGFFTWNPDGRFGAPHVTGPWDIMKALS